MRFAIVLYPSEEGYAVGVPSLPGCWSQGATRDEALENISIAIREYLETEIEPEAGAEVQEVDVLFRNAEIARRQSPGRD
jgi:predicted RNase H-like HicB family nuclease